MACLGYFFVLPRESDQRHFCKDHLAMTQVSESNRRIRPPRPPEDAFADFVKRSAAPDLHVPIYRKSRGSRMVAVRATDGLIHLLFDYRHLADALFAVEAPGGRALPVEREGGFLNIQVPADIFEVAIHNLGPQSQKLPLDKWNLDGSFADRERLLRPQS